MLDIIDMICVIISSSEADDMPVRRHRRQRVFADGNGDFRLYEGR